MNLGKAHILSLPSPCCKVTSDHPRLESQKEEQEKFIKRKQLSAGPTPPHQATVKVNKTAHRNTLCRGQGQSKKDSLLIRTIES